MLYIKVRCFHLAENMDQSPLFLGVTTAKEEMSSRRELLRAPICPQRNKFGAGIIDF